MVKSQKQHSVPVPCGFEVLQHLSQQSVGIVGYKFRSTNVRKFIFGLRSLKIDLSVSWSVRVLESFLIRVSGDVRELHPGVNRINVL